MDPPAADDIKVDHAHTYPQAEDERIPSPPPEDGAATEEVVVAPPEEVEVEDAHDHEPLDPAVASEVRPPSPLPSSHATTSALPHPHPHPHEDHYHHEMGGYHPYYPPPPYHHHYYPPPPHHPHHPPPPHGWPTVPNASTSGTPSPHHYSPYHHYHRHPKSSPPPSSHIDRENAENVYPATPSHSNGSHYHRHHSSGGSSSSTIKVPTSSRRRDSDASGGYNSSAHHAKVSPTTPASGSKAQRGLRHFSIMVCRFVEHRRVTTYNQVADELVRQVAAERATEKPKGKFDEKNIRRRVYDALNVLLAMDIISKEKKDIIWKGLPTTASEERKDAAKDAAAAAAKEDAEEEEQVQPVYTDEAEYEPYEFEAMERERQYREAEIKRKHSALREILVQQVCFRNLVMHNREREEHAAPHPITTVTSSTDDEMPPPTTPPSAAAAAAQSGIPKDEKIPLPFIICNTKPSAVVQCDMNKEKSDVMFEFDNPFEINDDNTVLKRMKMDKASAPVLQEMMPEDMFTYLHQAGLLDAVMMP